MHFFRIYFHLVAVGKRKLGLYFQKHKELDNAALYDLNEIFEYFLEMNEDLAIEKIAEMSFDSTEKNQSLMKVFNETDLSNDQLSHASAKKDVFDFNYSSKTLNLKTSITFHQFKQYMQSLSNLLEFSTRNNEAPCGK